MDEGDVEGTGGEFRTGCPEEDFGRCPLVHFPFAYDLLLSLSSFLPLALAKESSF